MSSLQHVSAVRRLDGALSVIDNPQGVPCTLLAREDVEVEPEAVEQVLEFLSLQDTLDDIWRRERAGTCAPFFGDAPGRIAEVVLTPDFHRGAWIPVGTVIDARGFVIPAAVGSDVCCGMRLLATDLAASELLPVRPRLEQRLRAIFFEGERDIPLSPRQREAMLREGLPGLHAARADNASVGLWRRYDPRAQAADLARVHAGGGFPTSAIAPFADYIRASGACDGRDPQIGSLGGGNHFVEFQAVEATPLGAIAHEWGLVREQVVVMCHTGSVGLGHSVGAAFREAGRRLHPAGTRFPAHGFHVLPLRGPHAAEGHRYLATMRAAANFAFANRLFLGLMALRALSEAVGREVHGKLVGDAPHNLVWALDEERHLHRKGACPAPGPSPEADGPFRYTGHPVIVPGSIGDASHVLAGLGNAALLASASHGAGRRLSRGASGHVDDAVAGRALAPLRVVTPIDPASPRLRGRPDIVAAHRARLKEEAPYAYKSVTPAIQTLAEARVALPVAQLRPLLTVKG
ncbi:MAG: RtcB family protein [Anaeromyxobacteraceae bacterium]